MSILSLLVSDKMKQEAEMRAVAKRKARDVTGQRLLGEEERVTGTMTSTDFDEAGQPTDVRETAIPERRQFGGLLGTNRTPEDMSKFSTSMLGAGYTPQDIQTVLSPLTTQRKREQDIALRSGAFANKKEELAAYNTVQNIHEKNIKPYRAAMEQFKTATQTIEDRGGYDAMTAQDDVAMITSFAKMLRPGEAVMADDVENVLNAMGHGDAVSAWISATGGKGMSGPARERLYTTMQSAYTPLAQQYEQVRTGTDELLAASRFSEDMPSPIRDTLIINPYTGPSAEPTFIDRAIDSPLDAVSGALGFGGADEQGNEVEARRAAMKAEKDRRQREAAKRQALSRLR